MAFGYAAITEYALATTVDIGASSFFRLQEDLVSQTPTIGRIVHYKLGPGDVAQIETRRNEHPHLVSGNRVEVGQVYPALIVRTWGEGSTTVQLQVFLDGNDSHWGSSRTEGVGEYQWTWPQR